MHDLAVVIPAMNEAHWLRALLPTLVSATEGLATDIVVADIESVDDTDAVVASYDSVRSVTVMNRGFAHANNVALHRVRARYVLFLNADTEISVGEFKLLLAEMDQRPSVGLVGVRQTDASGNLYPTMRRFASPARALSEALASERWAPSLGHRVLDLASYQHEQTCDWTIGSFMLVRWEALMAAGWLDERFFFMSEEQDFCLRIRRGGWDIRHLPFMTIVHHAGKRGPSPRFAAQGAYAERQYAELNMGWVRRKLYVAALALRFSLRAWFGSADSKRAAKAAVRGLRRSARAPFLEPPRTAVPSEQGRLVREGRPA